MTPLQRNQLVEKLLLISDLLDRNGHKEEVSKITRIIREAWTDPEEFDDNMESTTEYWDQLIEKYELGFNEN